ncbi:Methyltransf_2 domain-containing protein/Dimerisation domain-containing protein [Cephalotus follicularis]|uniref:Methyltransf_2 domain-containing protein/Dimerisation domain-containing protein n=1 Tax=Cephalotus follicularis TaxID=3775 RepID=A0A1Q3C793_CEPFO|nr:Methyltransf_2 domain-containing protein/Dimerisation domain-containing protein [Cephalotus follicularis]
MDLANGEHVNKLLQAQAHVWNHTFSFINSMSLKCAIQLCIPDVIHNHGKPITLDELVAALQINPTKVPGLHRLMRILIHSGFFAREKFNEDDQEEGYTLTPASRLLLKDHPLSMAPFPLALLDPIFTKPWDHLSNWFLNDDPTPFYTAHGREVWDYASHEPKLNHFFNEAMASDARLVSGVLMHKCKGVFKGLESLVDVGGGTGTMAKAIAMAFPNIDCTVFDLPHVVADLKSGENLKYVGGDMFEKVPPADAVMLKWILHDWNDELCVEILKKCKDAIKGKAGGKVIIIDMITESKVGDKKSIETQLFFDMEMTAIVRGRERNEKEWAKLFLDAGFRDYKITPILGLRSLIEIYPPKGFP